MNSAARAPFIGIFLKFNWEYINCIDKILLRLFTETEGEDFAS